MWQREVPYVQEAVSRPQLGIWEKTLIKSGKDEMPKFPLILALMAIVAVIIIAMAIYVFTNFSRIDFTQSLILIGIGVVGIIIVIGILVIVYKSNKPRK